MIYDDHTDDEMQPPAVNEPGMRDWYDTAISQTLSTYGPLRLDQLITYTQRHDSHRELLPDDARAIVRERIKSARRRRVIAYDPRHCEYVIARRAAA